MHPIPTVAIPLFALVPSLALATGYSVDIEMVRPTSSAAGIPGVEAPYIDGRLTTRAGLSLQYEHSPLVYLEWGRLAGRIVESRLTFQGAASLDLSRAFSIRTTFPVAYQWGSDVPQLAADGGGTGDLSVGLLTCFGSGSWGSVGLHADMYAPTGKREAWLGESGVRGGGGLLAAFGPRHFSWMFDIGAVMRGSSVRTIYDYSMGSELVVSAGVRVDVVRDRFTLHGSGILRSGFNQLFEGGAETTSEVILGAQIKPPGPIRIELAGGRGVTIGYGSTVARFIAGVTWSRANLKEKAPRESEVVVVPPPPPPPIDLPDEKPPEKGDEWEEGELAQVDQERIRIRDPIQFEQNTAKILPESLPTLEAVADVLNSDALIGHVLIEGHASEEGTFEYNYQLSNLRARSVFEALVTAGVHPDRLSYRGMGEVEPVVAGEDEEHLAPNRRVEFRILYRYDMWDKIPVFGTHIRIPWTGEDATVREPPPPEKPAVEEMLPKEPPKPEFDPDSFDNGEEDLDDLDLDLDLDGEEK